MTQVNSITISKDSWDKIVKELEKNAPNMTKEVLKHYSGSITLNEDPLSFQKRIRSEW